MSSREHDSTLSRRSAAVRRSRSGAGVVVADAEAPEAVAAGDEVGVAVAAGAVGGSARQRTGPSASAPTSRVGLRVTSSFLQQDQRASRVRRSIALYLRIRPAMSPAASTSRLAALPAAGPDDGGSPRSQYSSELEIDDPREGSQLLRTISHTSSIAGSVLSRITSDIFDSPQDRWDGPSPGGSRDKLKRRLMLGCACSLSLGSHYGSHLIGPLKHRLGEKETTFSCAWSRLSGGG